MGISIEKIKDVFGKRKAGAEEFFKFFSVLVPVVERKGRLFLLYEVRGKKLVRQPGEICFPGGEMERDESPQECALRETWEEIGVLPGDIEVVAQLDTIYTYSSFAMYCFLGIIKEEAVEALTLSTVEVEEVFFVALDDLLSQEPEVYTVDVVPDVPEDFPYDRVTGGDKYSWRKGKAPVPVYDIDNRVIWGLTARITKRFIDEIKEAHICLK